METLQFKTNINCGGCVAKITGPLNENANIKNWRVDTANPKKILTIETTDLSAEQIMEIVEKAGFKAEVII